MAKKESTLRLISANVTKKGKLKGKNKKETKELKAKCEHWRFNKKGKKKPTIYNAGDGTCTCTMCGAKFSASPYKDDELTKIFDDINKVINQAKFMSVAIGADDAAELFSGTSVALKNSKKAYKKVRNVAIKSSKLGGKKKKNHENGGGSSQFGSWETV